MKKEYLTQAWLVLILALLMGGSLAAVELWLRPRIEINRKRETLSQVPNLVPGAVKGELMPEMRERFGRTVIRAVDQKGKQVGWVIEGAGPGYAGDPITLLIGMDDTTQRIHGIYILEQKETPNLGSQIAEMSFRSHFEGTCGDGCLRVTKGKNPKRNEIQAITGATLSSEAVVKIVNRSASAFRETLFGPEARDAPPEGTSVPNAGEGRSYGG
jgi:electron transport complex protein RnfG